MFVILLLTCYFDLMSVPVFCTAISSSTLDLYTFYVDEGKNLTLPCQTTQGPVMWVREGRGGLEEVLVSYFFLFLFFAYYLRSLPPPATLLWV